MIGRFRISTPLAGQRIFSSTATAAPWLSCADLDLFLQQLVALMDSNGVKFLKVVVSKVSKGSQSQKHKILFDGCMNFIASSRYDCSCVLFDIIIACK